MAVGLVAASAGCTETPPVVEEPVYNTDHPDKGKVIFNPVWPADQAPELFTVLVGLTRAELAGTGGEFPSLFDEGEYDWLAHNEPAGITLSGAAASVDQRDGYALSPEWLYSGSGTVSVKKDTDHRLAPSMSPLVRRLNLTLKFADGERGDVSALSAELSGVAASIDMRTGEVSGRTQVKPAFTLSGSEYTASHNLLGVTGPSQTMSITVTLPSGTFEVTGDVSEALAGFNGDKTRALDVELTVSNLGLSSMSVDVTGWKNGEIHGSGEEKPILDNQISIEWPGMDTLIEVVELYDADGVLYTAPVEDKKTVGLYQLPDRIDKMNIIYANRSEEVTLNILSYDNAAGRLVMTDEYNLSEARHFEMITDMAGTYIVRSDIDFADVAPKQIGSWVSASDNVPFTGVFDGGGFSLKNLAFELKSYRGLVALNRGTIENVVVAALSSSGKLLGNQGSVGTIGVMCAINEGTIRNCTNNARVDGQSYAGGMAGQNRGTIEGCANYGQITGINYGGGMTGLNAAGATIAGCRNFGQNMGMTKNGGIAGENAGKVSSATNSGTILSYSGNGGGIVGHNNAGQIESSTNSGAITVVGTPQYMGGIAGQTSGTGNSIVGCSNSGSVTAAARAGGIVGLVSMGTVSACENSGAVKGAGETAGIAGSLGGIGGSVNYCENRGTVTGTATRVGGIVGLSAMCTISSCINHAAATVQGTLTTGGILGEGSSNSWIENCYNLAEVVTAGDRAGGIAGKNAGSVTASKNSGYVHHTSQYPIYTGGIVAEASTNHTITASYNTGEISGYSNIGGIAGYHNTGCTSTAVYSVGAITGANLNADRASAITGYNLATGKIYAAYWSGTDRGIASNLNTNADQVQVYKFADPDNTVWPTESQHNAWRVASGGNGFSAGYYWASLGNAATATYPTLWWEKDPANLLIGVGAMPQQ